MSIIGELKFADDAFKPTAETLRLLYGETWGKGYDMGFDAGYASADAWFVDHTDELAEHGWVKLPMDADGVPIRVGDVMEGEKIGGGFGEPFEVVGYIMRDGVLEPMDKNNRTRNSKYSHHHHEPTVENLLREFADRYLDYEGIPSAGRRGIGEALMNEYADRIREAVHDEEDE